MAYSPNNLDLYTAVFSGSLTGMGCFGKWNTSDDPETYSNVANVAGAFAQEVDTLWGLNAVTELELGCAESGAEGVWSGRLPIVGFAGTNPASYQQAAKALIATMNKATSYYTAAGITSPTSSGSGKALTQANWYINALTGSDNNSGTAPNKPLKTYAEWQARVGQGTLLVPNGGVLTITLQTSLPDSDPVTFNNSLAGAFGEGVVITGTPIVLKQGTLTGAADKDRAANTPNKITAAGLGAAHVNMQVLITSGPAAGSTAWVAEDLGGGQLMVSEWMAPMDFDGFTFSSTSPTAGAGYKILDFTQARVSECDIYSLASDLMGFSIRNIHTIGAESNMPVCKGSYLVSAAYGQCIIDTDLLGAYALGGIFNCCMLGNAQLSFCDVLTLGGLFHPNPGTGYPGGLILADGSTAPMDCDVMFDGDQTGYADIQIKSGCLLYSGPLSFWNALHAITCIWGGQVVMPESTPVNGESGYIPLWGTGNSRLLIGQGAIQINQFTDGPTIPILPTIVMGSGPGGHVIGVPNLPTNQGKMTSFVQATATYTPLVESTWANMAVAQPAGFEVARVLAASNEQTWAQVQYPGESELRISAFRSI